MTRVYYYMKFHIPRFLTVVLLYVTTTFYAQQGGAFKDPRDGQIYSTIKIGNQTWMAENMRFNISGSYLNPDNPDIKYGRLYTWEQAKKVCPKGWHLSNAKDWENLITYLENKFDEKKPAEEEFRAVGHRLKTIEGWNDPEFSSNSISFNALPAGFYSACSKTFDELGTLTAFYFGEETDVQPLLPLRERLTKSIF